MQAMNEYREGPNVDGSLWTKICGRKFVDGSLWTEVCGRKFVDGSESVLTTPPRFGSIKADSLQQASAHNKKKCLYGVINKF